MVLFVRDAVPRFSTSHVGMVDSCICIVCIPVEMRVRIVNECSTAESEVVDCCSESTT